MPETSTASTAVFKLFGSRSGAMLFDDAATVVAEALNVKTTPTSENAPSLRVEPGQFEQAESALEEKGFTVRWHESSPTIISASGRNATIYGQAAVVASKHLSKPYGETDSGVPKLKVDRSQVEDLKQHLTERGFTVEVQERESTHKPKVVLRESEDDRYFVYDRSAENLAEAMQRDLDRTPGGRPMLVFDRSEYKQIQQQYGNSLEISTKTLKLEATIATYDGNSRGGVITGKPALEVAGIMNLEPGWTRPTAAGASMEKVNLTEAQIPIAAQLLKDQGYHVEIKALESTMVANVSRLPDGSIRLFGTPAEQVASALNLAIEPTRNFNSMLRLTADQREPALEVLKGAGWEPHESYYKPSTSASTTSERSAPVGRGSPTENAPVREVAPTKTQAEKPQAQLQADSKELMKTSLGQLVQYFQTSQTAAIEQSDSGMKVQFDPQAQTLTAQTSEGRLLSASLETRKIKANFTDSDVQNLARLATATQQQSESHQPDVEIG